ncbi:hypothetical protein [Nocardioides lianchengensis]|uniref:Uncharacterized protein n=1 Tax=Nocardioides lianchengensis TaxID=1045774 RepID=A0A1G6R6W9_9ACTN|nr:hypothetical protein [Nocardioides lianchengensis]NYG10349.1 hypothetical protein [Nocardioides lianchengensis]SDD00153.1 hypothetical protein SAMN05421872_105169 [Nocardioides lianchengensis]
MSTLHDRLADLADTAPEGGPEPELWDRGRRYGRRRRVEAAAAWCLVVVAVAAGALMLGPRHPAGPDPVDLGRTERNLPRTVHAPSGWAPGSDEVGPPGPLAAIAVGMRKWRDGLTGMRTAPSVFGVSAVDGSARWIDLPFLTTPEARLGLGPGSLTLSPDGTRIGYTRFVAGSDGEVAVAGWAVYDNTTGRARKLEDPEMPAPQQPEGLDLGFTGDSRFLVTSYSKELPVTNRTDALVVWDIETGEPLEAEAPGKYWLPNMGAGPHGVVWSRSTTTFTLDPVSRTTSRVVVPQEVVQASFAPHGRGFAYIGHRKVAADVATDWFLYAGHTPAAASGRQIEIDIEPGRILGWRDSRRVVVDDFQGAVRIVDVVTGESVEERLSTGPDQGMAPVYAADLWSAPLVDGVEPPVVPGPRHDLLVWLVVVLGVGSGALLLWRRRVRP